MYLTLRQHDQFRTLLMGFEIPYRLYVSQKVISCYPSEELFENAMSMRNSSMRPSDPTFMKSVLSKFCKGNSLRDCYRKLVASNNAGISVVESDLDLPTVGMLNLVTFTLDSCFIELYNIFNGYSSFCNLGEKYRYARNKLGHPGCRTLEEHHLVPVLSFVKDICIHLDESFFTQKSKEDLLKETNALQCHRLIIPIERNNFSDMPYGDSRIVCRETEINTLKKFIYGAPEELRKRHSCCIYGYGGVGKTALALEAVKEILQDILDNRTENDYSPKYVFFFSAKKHKLAVSPGSGRITEQQISWHFETADELIELIHRSLDIATLRAFHDTGLFIIDNLETLTEEDRNEIRNFIEVRTPSEMQFIITSRNSEEYESNTKLAGFEEDSGRHFIETYIDENALELQVSENEVNELLFLSKGNTLVLVLCLRRLSQQLSTMSGIKADFSSKNAWTSVRDCLTSIPPNAYEVVSEFMFRDTFEHLETLYYSESELLYRVLKIFAIIQDDEIDISTICILINCPYPQTERVIDLLCNFLILERKKDRYKINSFAEKYIVGRFMPDASTYELLSFEIQKRRREIKDELEQLEIDISERPALAKILQDWIVTSDCDRIAAAQFYRLYGEAKRECNYGGKYKLGALIEEINSKLKETEAITAHPYIKYQKARIMQMIDNSRIMPEKHEKEIISAFRDALYIIKTVEQYAPIQQTKSYASVLWLTGQYLHDKGQLNEAIRYFEEGKESFESQAIRDKEYFQCLTQLAESYLDFYEEDRPNRLSYLRRARTINQELQRSFLDLGGVQRFASQLRNRLTAYGPR